VEVRAAEKKRASQRRLGIGLVIKAEESLCGATEVVEVLDRWRIEEALRSRSREVRQKSELLGAG
jgi:hypothetical protein